MACHPSTSFRQADMRDDSAVYGAISTKLHTDAEHIARETAPPGIRMADIMCIIGLAWRHHARGMWVPALYQARRTQVHLCRLVVVRVVLAVPAADPIELTGDSGTAPELLALPISAGGFAMPLFVERFFLRHGGQHHSRLGPAFYLPALEGWLAAATRPRTRAWFTQRGPWHGSLGGKSRYGSRASLIGHAREPPRLRFGTRQIALAPILPSVPSRWSRAVFLYTASLLSSTRTDVRRSCSTMARRRRKRRYSRARLQQRTQRWRLLSWQHTTSPSYVKGARAPHSGGLHTGRPTTNTTPRRAPGTRHHARTTTHDDEKMLRAHTGTKPKTPIDGACVNLVFAPATGPRCARGWPPSSSHASVA